MDDRNTGCGRDAPEQPVLSHARRQHDGRARRQPAHVAPGDDVQDSFRGFEGRLHVRRQRTRRYERPAVARILDRALTGNRQARPQAFSRTENRAQSRNSTERPHVRDPSKSVKSASYQGQPSCLCRSSALTANKVRSHGGVVITTRLLQEAGISSRFRSPRLPSPLPPAKAAGTMAGRGTRSRARRRPRRHQGATRQCHDGFRRVEHRPALDRTRNSPIRPTTTTCSGRSHDQSRRP